MPDFDEFFVRLKEELVDLAESRLDALADRAIQDGEQFLDDSKEDLRRWTQLLEEGRLSEEDVASLVRGKKDLAEMKALKQAGLAAVEADRFREALLSRVIGTMRQVFV
jgi:hypothetical protein